MNKGDVIIYKTSYGTKEGKVLAVYSNGDVKVRGIGFYDFLTRKIVASCLIEGKKVD